jgi:hypothetical protein
MFIRVGVLDHVSNKNGTLELPLKIAKPKAPALPQTQKQP